MSHHSSKFWTIFALPASLLILAAAYYIKVPSVREAIDARTSIPRQLLGRLVPESSSTGGDRETSRSKEISAVPASGQGSATAQTPGAGGPATPTPGPSNLGSPPVFDLQKLARDRTLWPKKVTLKKPATFPAVVNGKVVGNIVAPVGTEANLKAIKDGMLGLEFEGGGQWVAVEDTDLAARVLAR